MDFSHNSDGISSVEMKIWKKRLFVNAIASGVSISAQVALGGVTTLHTYNKIYHLQQLDRIGAGNHKFKSDILRELFVMITRKGVFGEKNMYTIVMRKATCALRTVKNSLILDTFSRVMATVIHSLATYPFNYYFHRYLLKEHVDKEKEGSFWGGFVYYLMGDFAFEITRYSSVYVLEKFFKITKKIKQSLFGDDDGIMFDEEDEEDDSFDQLIDLFNRFALTYFVSTFLGLLASEPFLSKSLNLQLGRIEYQGLRHLFNFKDLPKRKNISELLMMKTSLKTVQNTLCSSSIYFAVNTLEAFYNVTGSNSALQIYKWMNEEVDEVTSY